MVLPTRIPAGFPLLYVGEECSSLAFVFGGEEESALFAGGDSEHGFEEGAGVAFGEGFDSLEGIFL